jgi:broad specificity phosphatase PhoE
MLVNMPMNLILVRHGEIDANVRKVYAGRSDDPLNETGRSQALAAAQELCGRNIRALYCSPLRRTIEKAAIIGRRIFRTPEAVESFNELLMGPWEGLSEAEVAERYPDESAIWSARPADLRIPGLETLQDLQHRALAGVQEIQRGLSDNSCVAVVSHVAVIRVLILWAEGRNLNDYKIVHVQNATLIEIILPPGAFNGKQGLPDCIPGSDNHAGKF